MTSNVKLTGIKALCGETKSLPRHGYGPCYEVFLSRSTGRVWGNYHTSRQNWTQYDNPDIIPCGYITTPATMASIKQQIARRLRIVDSYK